MNKLEKLRNIKVSAALDMRKNTATAATYNGFCCFGFEKNWKSLDFQSVLIVSWFSRSQRGHIYLYEEVYLCLVALLQGSHRAVGRDGINVAVGWEQMGRRDMNIYIYMYLLVCYSFYSVANRISGLSSTSGRSANHPSGWGADLVLLFCPPLSVSPLGTLREALKHERERETINSCLAKGSKR